MSNGETRDGVKAAIEIVGAGVEPAPDGGANDVQNDFFASDAPMPMAPAKGTSGPRGGRPAGARNRRTTEWVDYLLSKYRSPLEVLLQTYSRSPEDLARELKLYLYHEGSVVVDAEGKPVLATGEAFKAQMAAAIAALPYIHQKLPMAIEVDGKTAGMILIGDLPQGSAEGLVLQLARNQQNQGVIDVTPSQSDASKSDATANPLSTNEEPNDAH